MSNWSDPLLPPAQTRLEAAIGQSMPPVGLDPSVIARLWSPADCPAALLPWLAWALSVDEWDSAWPEATQRAVCAASLPVHKRKGTVGAVRRAIDALGYRTRLIEAWQQNPPGAPHTFTAEIEIDDRGLDAGLVRQMERQIAAVKPERSHFDVVMVGRSDACIGVGVVTLSGAITTIYPLQITAIEALPATPTLGIATQSWGTTTITPLQ